MTNRRNPHPSSQEGASRDERLVLAAREGDQAALESLLMRAQEIAYGFSRVICGASASDAEDAMQDALLNVYRHASQIREPKAFRAWLYRTIKNACLVGRRRRVHAPERLLSLDDLMPGGGAPETLEPADPRRNPEQLTMDARTRTRLRRALAGLPPGYRMIVFLRDIEGLSTREVAQVVGISEDNVKTRLHRARLQLRRSLEDR